MDTLTRVVHVTMLGAWALLLVLVVSEARAAELTQDQATGLYAMAYGQAGFIPDKAPIIRVTKDMPCQRCLGWQQDDVIYLSDTLDFSTPLALSIVLHEMTHYIAYVRYGRAKDCGEWLRREYEAYGVQIRALEKAGHDATQPRMSMKMLQCSTPAR